MFRRRAALLQPAQDAISASVPVERLTPQREREIVDALRTMGDKVSRVVRPLANGDKWFALIPKIDAVAASINAMTVLDVHRTRS